MPLLVRGFFYDFFSATLATSVNPKRENIMKPELLKLLMSRDFYLGNKHRVKESMFDDSDLKPIYRTIIDAHKKFDTDLSPADVMALYESANPAETRSKRENLRTLLSDIMSKDALTEAIAEDVLHKAYQQDVGMRIANMGLQISEGLKDSLSDIRDYLSHVNEDFSTKQSSIEPCTTDIDELFAQLDEMPRWKFNIPALNNKVEGIAAGELCIVFARPETGKTAAHVSFAYGPGGWAEQGADVHTFVNEEPSKRTMVRAISAWTGITRDEIEEDPAFARDEWRSIKDNVNMADAHGMSMDELEVYCEKHNPDIIVVDQLDKMQITGNFARTDEKLRAIYTKARDIAQRYNLAFVAVSQASAEAEGKTRLNPTEMEGSKTGKFAEADMIIGIGRTELGADEDPDYTRYLTVGKNKITGWHGVVICMLEPKVSRYVA
jgi:replicative DNA helicase